MKEFLRNLFWPQTYRTPAELPKDQFFMFRGINRSRHSGLRAWGTR